VNSNPDLEKLFDNSKTIYNDLNSYLYINRLQKMRIEEDDRKRRISPDLSKIFLIINIIR